MEAQQSNIKFSKNPLISKVLDLNSNPYKVAFCDKIVDFATESVIHRLPKIKEKLTIYGSVIISDFLTSHDLSDFIGDGHFDAKCNTRYLQCALTKSIGQTLQQELEMNTIKVRVDYSIGLLIINLKH